MTAGKAIWIAIPTFRRPVELRHLLDSLAKQIQRHDVMLLVADNDATAQEGAAVVPVPQPGLCAVRNAIFATAMADPAMRFIAMIDDDEWPQPGWLDALLSCQGRMGADVVAGPVDCHFQGRPPSWARETLIFRPEQRAWGATGMLWASYNLLVSR